MSIYDDLLNMMDDGIAERVLSGFFITLVRSGQRCGLSTTQYPEGEVHAARAVHDAGDLAGRSLSSLAGLVFSDKPMERSLGMAALNAGLSVEGLTYSEADSVELLARKSEGKSLAVVGHFAFVRRLARTARSLSVLELKPKEGDIPADRASEVIPSADVVAITGSSFSNGTVEGLLELARDKWVMVLGPTTPLSPVLFDYGADAVAGSVVTDKEQVFCEAGEGAIFRQLSGIKKVLAVKHGRG